MSCFLCGGKVHKPVEFECGFLALFCDLCLSCYALDAIMTVVEARHTLAVIDFTCDCPVMSVPTDDQDPS